MKIIDHLVVKINKITASELILYLVSAIAFYYATQILIIIFE